MQLKHVPGDPLPWQWHEDREWIDEHTGDPTSYVAGLKTEDHARRYGKRHGWCDDGTEN